MASRDLLDPAAKTEVGRAVRDLEKHTAAEVVVAVRPQSGHYRHTDYLVGAAFALVALCVFLFHPAEFDDDLVPLEMAFVFATSALLTSYLGPLRRLLTSKTLMQENVRTAARATFVDLGVSSTEKRTGLLVYVSAFEKKVELVTDIGIDPKSTAKDLEDARKALEASIAASGDLSQFLAALASLGKWLSNVLPRAEDDRNELPDEVSS